MRKTVWVLVHHMGDYEWLDSEYVVAVFKTEKAARAHVTFVGDTWHSAIHYYTVEEVESFL